MESQRQLHPVLALGLLMSATLVLPPAAKAFVPVVHKYETTATRDQDDMCIWVHRTDPTLSTIIASDKASGDVFVYDLPGNLLQTIQTGQPGNIDIRYGVELGGNCYDVVGFNERSEGSIRVYAVDPSTRLLSRIDDGTIDTGSNYGFTFYRDAAGTLYGFTGPSGGAIRKYHLFDNGAGLFTGVATAWTFSDGVIEGMVADQETGMTYFASEPNGIWRVDPMNHLDATLIAATGDTLSGLTADVEGLAIYYAAGGAGYLLASSQGASKITVFERQPPYTPVGEFSVSGVGSTDGIDVLNMNLGPLYPNGIFTLHNGSNCCPVVSARWDSVAVELGGAIIDTDSWDPRRNCDTSDTTTVVPRRQGRLWNHPNPFNPTTTIRFQTSEAGPVQLGIHDIGGRLVQTLLDASMDPGEHELTFRGLNADGQLLPSGIYVAQLTADNRTDSIKLVLTK